jgi:hypothetical protein
VAANKEAEEESFPEALEDTYKEVEEDTYSVLSFV